MRVQLPRCETVALFFINIFRKTKEVASIPKGIYSSIKIYFSSVCPFTPVPPLSPFSLFFRFSHFPFLFNGVPFFNWDKIMGWGGGMEKYLWVTDIIFFYNCIRSSWTNGSFKLKQILRKTVSALQVARTINNFRLSYVCFTKFNQMNYLAHELLACT